MDISQLFAVDGSLYRCSIGLLVNVLLIVSLHLTYFW